MVSISHFCVIVVEFERVFVDDAPQEKTYTRKRNSSSQISLASCADERVNSKNQLLEFFIRIKYRPAELLDVSKVSLNVM